MTIKSTGVEILCYNLYFLVFFLTTIYYWIKIIFFGSQKSIFAKKQVFENGITNSKNFGLVGIFGSNFLITIELILRWVDSGHFPLSNLYESLLFLAWGLLTFY